jgi:hypothetical protein
MRILRLILVGVAAIAAAAPAFAQGNIAAAPKPVPGLSGNDNLEIVTFVNPGDQIGIACTALAKSDQDSDVRVVLTISAEPGETPPGYKRVLATDEQVGHGAVRVRIPAMPDLQDRTVNVNVYVVGSDGAQSCDAGHMKVVRQPAPSGTIG